MTEPNRLNRMYRLRDLPQFVGLRRTQIAELIKNGNFPGPLRFLTPVAPSLGWSTT